MGWGGKHIFCILFSLQYLAQHFAHRKFTVFFFNEMTIVSPMICADWSWKIKFIPLFWPVTKHAELSILE